MVNIIIRGESYNLESILFVYLIAGIIFMIFYYFLDKGTNYLIDKEKNSRSKNGKKVY